MKHIAFFLFLISLGFNGISQDYIPTKEDIKRFSSTKTMIVHEDNRMSEFNLMMDDVVPKEWTVTPYEFISRKDFDAQRKNASSSFVMLNRVMIEKDKSNAQYLFMSLLLGGNAKSVSSMPDLCSIPLAYYGVNEETYAYKLGIFLRFMQNHAQLLKEDPSIAKANIFKYYNKNIQKLEGKTLYLIASELDKDVDTEAKIKKVYNGSFKLVTEEEIQKAISERDPNVVFLHKVGPEKSKRTNARCFKILVGAADAQFYYFDYHKVSDKSPDAFLASDFKSLSRKN